MALPGGVNEMFTVVYSGARGGGVRWRVHANIRRHEERPPQAPTDVIFTGFVDFILYFQHCVNK